jgi:hypothetical protein
MPPPLNKLPRARPAPDAVARAAPDAVAQPVPDEVLRQLADLARVPALVDLFAELLQPYYGIPPTPLHEVLHEAAKRAVCAPLLHLQRLSILSGLERVRGKIDFDGLERVSSQTLLDILEVPQRSRTAGAYRHLAKIMAELGWTAVRVRDLTRGGYKEQVRGYARDTRNGHRSTVPNRECAPVGSSAPV